MYGLLKESRRFWLKNGAIKFYSLALGKICNFEVGETENCKHEMTKLSDIIAKYKECNDN